MFNIKLNMHDNNNVTRRVNPREGNTKDEKETKRGQIRTDIKCKNRLAIFYYYH